MTIETYIRQDDGLEVFRITKKANEVFTEDEFELLIDNYKKGKIVEIKVEDVEFVPPTHIDVILRMRRLDTYVIEVLMKENKKVKMHFSLVQDTSDEDGLVLVERLAEEFRGKKANELCVSVVGGASVIIDSITEWLRGEI